MKNKKKNIAEMTDEEMKNEMTEIISNDIMRFVEVIIKKRVSLFVEEIHKGVKEKK